MSLESHTPRHAGFSSAWGDFGNNGGYGLDIKSNGAVSVAYANVNNNGTAEAAALIDNSSAATPMSVTITKSKFNDNTNAIRGIQVLSRGTITFSNNEVNNNRGANAADQGAAEFDNCGFDKLSQTCTGTGTGNVTVTASMFNHNGNAGEGNGLLVFTRGNVLLTNLVASMNDDEGIEINAASGNGTITLNGTANKFNGNGDIGAAFLAKNNISVANIVAENNRMGLLTLNCDLTGTTCSGAGTGTVTVTNANLNKNRSEGLFAASNGTMALTNVSALGNGTIFNSPGAYLVTNAKDITITGSSFSGNYGGGIQAYTGGSNTLKLIGTFFFGNDVNTNGEENLYCEGFISIS